MFAFPVWEVSRRVLDPVIPVDGLSAELVARKVFVEGIRGSVRFSGRLVSAHKGREVSTCSPLSLSYVSFS